MTKKNIKLSDAEVRKVWDNTAFGGGRNNLLFRKDVAGAYIKISEYNKETEFGWVLDLLEPLEKGGKLEVNNCLALHWKNAKARKAKTEEWQAVITGVISNDNKRDFQKPVNIKTDKIVKAKDMKIKEVSAVWDKEEN
ncbi:MAG: hypothetical protein LBS95_02830 [Mycoplasmataceae bacterium]|nr:hypothetical protein [Mycoplasmataceae bacterium]